MAADAWLALTVPELPPDNYTYLIWELRRRGWTAAEIDERINPLRSGR
jgi:hypothetical protein